MRPGAGAAAGLLFILLGLLHAHWALGGFWPGHDSESLAQRVVGTPPGVPAPGPGACWGVAILLFAAAAVVLGAAGWLPLPLPGGLLRGAAWFGAAVLLLRALAGFALPWMGFGAGTPFARLNRILYSPLCALLALLTALAAGRP